MEWECAVQWVERTAPAIATVEFGVLVMSGLGGIFGWIIMRGRHKSQMNTMLSHHGVLMSRLDEHDAILKEIPTRAAEMIGKTGSGTEKNCG